MYDLKMKIILRMHNIYLVFKYIELRTYYLFDEIVYVMCSLIHAYVEGGEKNVGYLPRLLPPYRFEIRVSH